MSFVASKVFTYKKKKLEKYGQSFAHLNFLMWTRRSSVCIDFRSFSIFPWLDFDSRSPLHAIFGMSHNAPPFVTSQKTAAKETTILVNQLFLGRVTQNSRYTEELVVLFRE